MKKPAEFGPLLERQRKRYLQDTGAVLWASAAFRTRGRPCGQALPSGHGGGLVGKRCLGGAGSAAQALPSGHGSGLLAEGLALQEGCRSGL